MRNLSILILTRNRLAMIRRLLSSGMFWDGLSWWRNLSFEHYADVIVLNQNSTDGTAEYLNDLHSRPYADPQWVEHVPMNYNAGCAGGRNALVSRLHLQRLDDIVVFLDDDIVPTSAQWLERLVAPILAGEADISGVDCRRIDVHGMTYVDASAPHYVSGGWMAVRAELFMIGRYGLYFDDQFNPNYYEDVDWCLRATALGARLVCVGEIGLLHTPEPTIGQNLAGDASRVKFLKKWAGKLEGIQT
ncbi:MAG: glycosyltransferase [Anaerolineae bacterium]|nr:glycosyltransferase [Anaerolineae bacterium]